MSSPYLPSWLEGKPIHEVSAQQVNTIAKHGFRQELAQGINRKVDSLENRIALFKMMTEHIKDAPENPAMIPGVEDRPELKVMGRFYNPPSYADRENTHDVSGFETSRRAAQLLIDSASRPITHGEWRGQAGRVQPHGEIRY